MTRQLTILFGVVFLLIGILGFVPGITTDGMLLGMFHVNLAHNLVHLLSGVIALLAVASGGVAPLWFMRIFGIVYGLVAVLGFLAGNQPVLGMIANNRADVWLHAAVSVVALVVGSVPISHHRHSQA